MIRQIVATERKSIGIELSSVGKEIECLELQRKDVDQKQASNSELLEVKEKEFDQVVIEKDKSTCALANLQQQYQDNCELIELMEGEEKEIKKDKSEEEEARLC